MNNSQPPSLGPENSAGCSAAPGECEIGYFISLSEKIPGWTRGEEAAELARLSFQQGTDAVIVEIGSFLGSGTIILAGPRRLRGSGKVHCIDSFDCSGDAFSVPHYQRILTSLGGGNLRNHFDDNIRSAGLAAWVEVHQGSARMISANWHTPIDLLFLDGDQSRAGAREAYDSWSPFLRPGGIIAIHNSHPDNHPIDHDGNWHLVETVVHPPSYAEIHRITSTTFARRG